MSGGIGAWSIRARRIRVSAPSTLGNALVVQHSECHVYRLPFSFDVPCDYWGRSAIIDPDDRDDERDFGLLYTLDLHITRSLGDNRSDTILVQFPRKKDVEIAMERHSNLWRNLYQRRFFSLVCSPVDPGEIAPPLEWVSQNPEQAKAKSGPSEAEHYCMQACHWGICTSARSD